MRRKNTELCLSDKQNEVRVSWGPAQGQRSRLMKVRTSVWEKRPEKLPWREGASATSSGALNTEAAVTCCCGHPTQADTCVHRDVRRSIIYQTKRNRHSLDTCREGTVGKLRLQACNTPV